MAILRKSGTIMTRTLKFDTPKDTSLQPFRGSDSDFSRHVVLMGAPRMRPLGSQPKMEAGPERDRDELEADNHHSIIMHSA